MKKLSKKTVIYDRPLVYRPDIAGNPQILHVDKSLLIVSKPSGLLSVPGKADGHKICLESVIKRDYPDARIVHRLDLATSGVMVMARTAAAHRHLGLQFERRHVEKSYLARVWGEVPAASGHIDMPMRCDWPNRPVQMIDAEKGKRAITNFKRLEVKRGVTRLRLMPITGRSHQLRLHMLALGFPILGDQLYAPNEAYRAVGRLQLHAESLSLYHPDGGERMTFDAACEF